MNIYGPRRKTEAGAQSDLDSMRGAAAEYSADRAEAYEAMRAEAARIRDRASRAKETNASLSKAGRVAEDDGDFRAVVPHTAATGQKAHLLGPRRPDAWAAEQDLVAMRGAAAVFPDDRVKAFQAMHAEARRIQDRAKYAREIQEATFRRMSSAASDSEEDDCLVMDELDPDEWWRGLQDGKTTSKTAEAKPRKEELTPLRATEELLMTFRPRVESVDELKRLRHVAVALAEQLGLDLPLWLQRFACELDLRSSLLQLDVLLDA